MPATAVGDRPALARGPMVGTTDVALRMFVAAAEINIAAAPLPVESAHRQPQCVSIGVPRNRERVAQHVTDLQPISPRGRERRKIRQRDRIARSAVLPDRTQLTLVRKVTLGERMHAKRLAAGIAL